MDLFFFVHRSLYLGEHSFKSLSLEDLVKSFDHTINACFADPPGEVLEECPSPSITPQEDLVASSKSVHSACRLASTSLSFRTWSELIENLRSSLRHDLKLPNISQSCQTAMQSISGQQSASTLFDEEITPIDDLNEDEEEELREQLDMHSVIVAATHEPFLTAEQVISEIDFMLQDMTPDSGYCDDQSNADILDLRTRRVKYLSPSATNDELDFKAQTIDSLNDFHEELNASIKDLSSLLVQVRSNPLQGLFSIAFVTAGVSRARRVGIRKRNEEHLHFTGTQYSSEFPRGTGEDVQCFCLSC